MAQFKYVVFTNAIPGREAEYNDWYTGVHLPDLLALEGFVSAQRFQLVETDKSGGEAPGGYLAIYELEGDDPEPILAQLFDPEKTAGMVMSEAIDLSGAKAHLFKPITGRVSPR